MAATRRWKLDGDSGTDSDCTPATLKNKKARTDNTDAGTELTATVSSSGSVQEIISWTTIPGRPGLLDWPSGTYKVSLDVSKIPSGTFLFNCRIQQVGSGCSAVTGVTDPTTASSTGVYTYSPTLNPPSNSKGDRYQIIVRCYYPSGADADFEVDVESADTYIEGPLGVTQAALLAAPRRLKETRRRRM